MQRYGPLVDEQEDRAKWSSIAHKERFKACRLAVRGQVHPDATVRRAAAAWARAVLSSERTTSARWFGLLDLAAGVAAPLGIGDVLDGDVENDSNPVVRWYARRLSALDAGH